MSELKRTLNLQDAVSIVAGSMIGSGIFIVSTFIARIVNSGLLLIFVWLLAGLITMLGALCYGELSSTIPDEGGQYIYLKKIFSKKLAFLYGWTLFLVIQTGTLAAVNIALAKFIGLIFPLINANNYLIKTAYYSLSTEQLFAIFVVIVLTFINSRGIKLGVLVQNIFTLTKILSIILIVIFGLFLGFHLSVLKANLFIPFILNFETIKLIMISITGALFASITWNNVTFITSEIKHPRKNIKKALFIGVGIVVCLYCLLNFIYLGVLPLELIKTSPQDIVAAQLAQQIFGQKALYIIAVVIAVSAFGCANGMILTGARVYYKMAKDRFFFRKLAYIDRKTRTPKNSLWLQCFWICILVLWGNYAQLLDYVIYSSIIFYTITIFGIFRMRKLYSNEKNIFKVPNFIPIAFIVLSSTIILSLSILKPLTTLPGLIITFLGIPVYFFWNKTSCKDS